MLTRPSKVAARGRALAVTLPQTVLDAAGLKPGDGVSLVVRDDGVIEIRHAVPEEAQLEAAFEWSLGRYNQTYEDLSK